MLQMSCTSFRIFKTFHIFSKPSNLSHKYPAWTFFGRKACHVCFPFLLLFGFYCTIPKALLTLTYRRQVGRIPRATLVLSSGQCWQTLPARRRLLPLPSLLPLVQTWKNQRPQTVPCLENGPPPCLLYLFSKMLQTIIIRKRRTHLHFYPLTKDFLQQIFIKCLVCARYHSRSLENISVSKKILAFLKFPV